MSPHSLQPCPLQWGQGRLNWTGLRSPNHAPQTTHTGARERVCVLPSRRATIACTPKAAACWTNGRSLCGEIASDRSARTSSISCGLAASSFFPFQVGVGAVPSDPHALCTEPFGQRFQECAMAALHSAQQQRRDAHRAAFRQLRQALDDFVFCINREWGPATRAGALAKVGIQQPQKGAPRRWPAWRQGCG